MVSLTAVVLFLPDLFICYQVAAWIYIPIYACYHYSEHFWVYGYMPCEIVRDLFMPRFCENTIESAKSLTLSSCVVIHTLLRILHISKEPMMRKSSVVKAVVASTFLMLLITPLAMAASASAPWGKAWSSGSTLYVRDGKGDSSPVYANFYRVGAQSNAYLYNYSGVGSTVSKNVGSRVTSVQICVDYWRSDPCSAWGVSTFYEYFASK